MMTKEPIIEMAHVKKYFDIRDSKGKKGTLKAVDDISITIHKGETFGIVGESGCGKSTLGKTLLNLGAITDGTILIDGQNVMLSKLKKKRSLFVLRSSSFFKILPLV